MNDSVAQEYAETTTLQDGAEIELRMMIKSDEKAILNFAKSLPQEDLLFLSMDLTQARVVQDWIRNIEGGRSISLLAFSEGALVGYGNIHKNATPWMKRVGEIRINIAPQFRGRGLGRLLISKIFDRAQTLGLRKLIAQMTTDQHGAQKAFRRLGFVPEALLADFVEDRNGTTRDLVMMTFDVDGHTDQAGGIVEI